MLKELRNFLLVSMTEQGVGNTERISERYKRIRNLFCTERVSILKGVKNESYRLVAK